MTQPHLSNHGAGPASQQRQQVQSPFASPPAMLHRRTLIKVIRQECGQTDRDVTRQHPRIEPPQTGHNTVDRAEDRQDQQSGNCEI